MKGWLDKYGKEINANEGHSSASKEWIGEGYSNVGRNYSPAWGGQFEEGGNVYPVNYVPQAQDGLTFLDTNSPKLPSSYVIPYRTPSSERARSIGGEEGESAFLIPEFKYGHPLEDPDAEFRKTGEHLGGPFKTWQEADEWERTVRHPYVEKGQDIPTPLRRWGKDFAMGGSIPGSVGFTYARTNSPAPSNGPYAKKTKASAQNGKEMSYYQHGLDWKPKSISKNGGWLEKYVPEAQTGFVIPGVTDFKMPLNRTDAPGLSIQEKQRQDAAAQEMQRRNEATAKRQFVGKGKASTKESEARRIMLNKKNTVNLPNVQIDQFGNTSAINPNMTYAGEPANFMGERQQKGVDHILGALEAAGYVEGLGALGSAAKKAVAQSMESGLLSNTYKINPWAFKANPEAFYRQIGKTGLTDATESGVIRSADISTFPRPHFVEGKDFTKLYSTGEGATGNTPSVIFETSGINQAGEPFVFPVNSTSGYTPWISGQAEIPLSQGKVLQKDWLRGYKEVPKPSIDFSKYLTQEEAVAARAERLISQKNKLGWDEQLTPELEQRLSTAVERHNPASDYPGEKLGSNTMGRTATEVSKHANLKGVPLNEANKARIAAHEVGHYYSNSLEEGQEWLKHFDLGKIESYKTKTYLRGKNRSTNYANEIRERAAQLKDYIAQKNGIPLNEDFVITQPMLNDAIKNYVSNTGLDNTMSKMLGALKDKKGLLKTMNKYALGTVPVAAALQQKKEGGVIKDDRGQWAHRGKVTEIQGNSMATHGYGDLPLYVVPDVGEPRMVEANTGNHTFPGATKFTEYPIKKKSKGWLDKYN